MIETVLMARAEQALARQHELTGDRLQARQVLAADRRRSAEVWREPHRRPDASRAAPVTWPLRLRHRLL